MSIEKLNINELHLEDLKNPMHPSHYTYTQDYSLLILKLPTLQNHRLETYNLGYVIVEDEVYFYDYESDNIKPLAQGFLSMYKKIDAAVDETTSLLEVYGDEVSEIEETLYGKVTNKKFMDIWFELKKDLARLERLFMKAHLVFKTFVRQNQENEKFLNYKFLDIQEHLDRGHKTVNLNLSKLDTIYNYYQSLKNDKLNNTLYTLTIISAIFLPLNLLVGFFGMNTTDLFFTQEAGGTMNVVYLLAMLVIGMVIAFPLIIKIYEKTFGRFLNRYEFYKKLTQKIKEIND